MSVRDFLYYSFSGEDEWSLTLVKISFGVIMFQLWSSLTVVVVRRRIEHFWYACYLTVSVLLLPFTLDPYDSDHELSILVVSFLSYVTYWKFYGVLFKINRQDGVLFYFWRGFMALYIFSGIFILLFQSTIESGTINDYVEPLGILLIAFSCWIYWLTYSGRDRVLVSIVVLGALSSDIVSLVGASYLVEISSTYGTRLHYFSYSVECLFFSLALTYSASQDEKVRHELEHSLLRERLNAMSNQMNMHFIANSLNSVYRFLLNREGDAATFYFLKFSHLLRGVLNHSREEMITIEEEADMLTLYLEMERLRFQHAFSFSVYIQEPSLAKRTKIPPFIIQPLLENAIHHGLLPKKKGHVYLSFNWEANLLKIIVEDNGIGRAAAAKNLGERAKNKKSLGLTIVQERLLSLQASSLQKASITIEDLYDQDGVASGTRAQIAIPLI